MVGRSGGNYLGCHSRQDLAPFIRLQVFGRFQLDERERRGFLPPVFAFFMEGWGKEGGGRRCGGDGDIEY